MSFTIETEDCHGSMYKVVAGEQNARGLFNAIVAANDRYKFNRVVLSDWSTKRIVAEFPVKASIEL